MEKIEIKELIVRALRLKTDAVAISDDDSLNEALGLTSINALELATTIEEKYEVSINDDQIYKVLENVNSIYEFILTEKNSLN